MKMHGDRLCRFFIPFSPLNRLHGQRLDRLNSMDGLDQHGLSIPFCGIQRLKSASVRPQEYTNDSCQCRRKSQDNKREGRAVEDEYWQEYKQSGAVEQRHEELSRKELTNLRCLLHVFRQHAGGHLLEELDRQMQHVVECSRCDSHVNLAGGVEEQKTSQVIEDCVEDDRDQNSDGDRSQGVLSIIDKHFVDHDLEV